MTPATLLRILTGCVILLQLSPLMIKAQSGTMHSRIEKELAGNNLNQAKQLLKERIDTLYKTNKADSMVNYIFLTGKIGQKIKNVDQGARDVNQLIDKIKSLKPEASTLRQAYIETGEFFGSAGKNHEAYNANKTAKEFTFKAAGKPVEFGMIENNMSTYAQRMGELNLSQQHARAALRFFKSEKHPDYENIFRTYNSMGSTMWYSSKTDSAMHYFIMALDALSKAVQNPENKFYRVATIQNNLAALYRLEGKTTNAINAMKLCIQSLNYYLATPESYPKKDAATAFQFQATDNLAGIYKELGNYSKAEELLQYSFAQKKLHLDESEPGIFISKILLGQLYYAKRNFEKAMQYLTEGVEQLKKTANEQSFWHADAHYSMALIYDIQKKEELAAKSYEEADKLYEESLQGDYDEVYLEFLRNASLFYSENQEGKLALSKANKAYDYIRKTNGEEGLPVFYQLMNLSEINYNTGNFKEALDISKKGLNVVNAAARASTNMLDSIHTEIKKPQAILLKSKSEYKLLADKDETSLKSILSGLQEALIILEKRKTILQDPADINILVSYHQELLEFVKKITLELYDLTGSSFYAHELISLHESGIYTRIRSRLEKSDSIQFAHIPVNITETEKKLKSAISASLKLPESHSNRINIYLKATADWNNYLTEIKAKYPRYFEMRYASIFKSISDIQKQIPAGTTIIRYFFVEDKLVAMVADRLQSNFFRLNAGNLEERIAAINSPHNSGKLSEILFSLYGELWKPLARQIRNKNVTIIPDGILHNLNFELLTSSPIKSYKDLSSLSLLASHSISYQYSLFLIGKPVIREESNNNFVAFAPGFTDNIKNGYRAVVNNAFELDNGYLSLLPQPFTIDLALKTQKLFGGDAFLYDRSTIKVFKENAAKNKIIHIGTHAESNNIYPEYSRLIFAKDPNDQENNSMYLFDIYNCDLSSDLTVLTACESGKPGYQDGEGMISLAHAFNYAGSESIVTGLWKIDEQTSALILDYFYENLADGQPKDEALRQAKLKYLANAKGRTIEPQYWAGLVLMGDTSPVDMSHNRSNYLLYTGGAVLLLIGSVLIYREKSNRNKPKNFLRRDL